MIVMLLLTFYIFFLFDAVVTAIFNKTVYSFSEGAGQASGIAIVLLNTIAQDLFILVYAGK